MCTIHGGGQSRGEPCLSQEGLLDRDLNTSSRFRLYKSASSNKAPFYWDVLAACSAAHSLSLLFSL